MTDIVFYGVGSPLVQEYEESCQRNGTKVAFGIQNVEAAIQTTPAVPVRSVASLTKQDTALPFIVPLFTPENRRLAVGEALEHGFGQAGTIIDATAIVAGSTQIGPGGYVNAGVIIGAASELGQHCVINRGCSIGHHNLLQDFVSIGPGSITCGNVSIGQNTMIGAGSVILPSVTIGEGCVVGAGSVVVKDIPPFSKWIERKQVTLSAINPDG